jgi:NADH/F420H2 dehydrogenase subunit C
MQPTNPATKAASITQAIQDRFGDQVLETNAFRGDETVILRLDALEPVLRFLRDEPGLEFNFLMDIGGVDYLTYPASKRERMEVVYHLYSLRWGHRVRIKVPVPFQGHVASVHHLWESADWAERECWEMFGITFDGHPNLRCLLTHKDFKGHPLQKSYQLKKRQVLNESDTMVEEMEARLVFKGLKSDVPTYGYSNAVDVPPAGHTKTGA